MALYDRAYLDELNRRNPPGEVADALGIPRRRGRAQCAFHGGDGWNLSFKGARAKCFSCGGAFDSIAIARRALGGWHQTDVPFHEAIDWLERRTGGIVPPHPARLQPVIRRAPEPPRKIYTAPPPPAIRLLDTILPRLEEELWRWVDADPNAPGNPLALARRRLKTDGDIALYRLGYSPGGRFLAGALPPAMHALAARHGLLAPDGSDRLGRRLFIPEQRLVELDGEVGPHIVSMAARQVVDAPAWSAEKSRKYLYLTGMPRPLGGLQFALDALRRGEGRPDGKGPFVVVTEGFFKSTAAARWGYPAVALGSNEPSDEIIGELRVLLASAVLLLVPDRDGRAWWRDETGRLRGPGEGPKGMGRTIRKMRLQPGERVVVVRIPPAYKGLDDLDDALPNGKARDVFEQCARAALRAAARHTHDTPRHGAEPARARNQCVRHLADAARRAAGAV